MEDSGIQENASHPNDAIKPINLEDLWIIILTLFLSL